jgi:hypothetical protein
MSSSASEDPDTMHRYRHRHLRFGWWSMWCYLTLGILLESMHGFKVGWYLGVDNETRRLMWTLAHAHGALLGLVHIAFAMTLPALVPSFAARRRAVSNLLIAASFLLPGGFFLGGIVVFGGDPNPAVLLAPVGALFMLIAVFMVASSVTPRGGRDGDVG